MKRVTGKGGSATKRCYRAASASGRLLASSTNFIEPLRVFTAGTPSRYEAGLSASTHWLTDNAISTFSSHDSVQCLCTCDDVELRTKWLTNRRWSHTDSVNQVKPADSSWRVGMHADSVTTHRSDKPVELIDVDRLYEITVKSN